MTPRLLETLTKRCSSHVWFVFRYSGPNLPLTCSVQHKGATESDLRREFETYGTIERVRIVRDKKGRGRGYAFVVYERERDMKGQSRQFHQLYIY